MAKIDYEYVHGMSQAAALEKARKLVDEVKGQFSSLVDEFVWSKDGSSATAKGRMFSAEVNLNDGKVRIQVELPGLAGKLVAPKVEAKLKELVTKFFAGAGK